MEKKNRVKILQTLSPYMQWFYFFVKDISYWNFILTSYFLYWTRIIILFFKTNQAVVFNSRKQEMKGWCRSFPVFNSGA